MSCLCERLNFSQLYSRSEPKRVLRSKTVRGPDLKIYPGKNEEQWYFNFKSNPSTTGLRHRGYIKFFKPKSKGTPMEKINCEVDCTCPDYKYRWAWANKQRQASRVGPRSMNQAWNRAPRSTNPSAQPGLCKHILALRSWIYGLVGNNQGDAVHPDAADALDKAVDYATKRWADFPGQMGKAKERDALMRADRAARAAGRPTIIPGVGVPPPEPAVTPSASPNFSGPMYSDTEGMDDQERIDYYDYHGWPGEERSGAPPELPPQEEAVAKVMSNSRLDDAIRLLEEVEVTTTEEVGDAEGDTPGSEALELIRDLTQAVLDIRDFVVNDEEGGEEPPDMPGEPGGEPEPGAEDREDELLDPDAGRAVDADKTGGYHD